ncbi:hypothetical protein evm_011417 [Chilo suppressalis]|nr:hypothetical protein evm_011417 [Chilo suppressalis]
MYICRLAQECLFVGYSQDLNSYYFRDACYPKKLVKARDVTFIVDCFTPLKSSEGQENSTHFRPMLQMSRDEELHIVHQDSDIVNREVSPLPGTSTDFESLDNSNISTVCPLRGEDAVDDTSLNLPTPVEGQRYPSRVRKSPDYFSYNILDTEYSEPTSYYEAMISDDSPKWQIAMQNEDKDGSVIDLLSDIQMQIGQTVKWTDVHIRDITSNLQMVQFHGHLKSRRLLLYRLRKQSIWPSQTLSRKLYIYGVSYDISEVCGHKPDCVTIYTDSQSAQSIASNPVYYNRTKHIDIKYHFIREKVSENIIGLKFIKSTEMSADVLTKPLGRVAQNKCVTCIGDRPVVILRRVRAPARPAAHCHRARRRPAQVRQAGPRQIRKSAGSVC